MEFAWVWVIIGLFVVYLIYKGVRREMDMPDDAPDVEGNYLSQVGDRSSGMLTCPYCGSSQFVAKRSAGGKAGLGCGLGLLLGPLFLLAALLAPKSRVRCVVCGREFRRG